MKALNRPFSFAVVSDTHFVRREFGNKVARVTNLLTPDVYVENVTYALAPMMDALREAAPDFLFITGDIIEASEGGYVEEDLKAALAFFSACEIPIIYARGNLDDADIFSQIVRPQMSKIVEQELDQNYFSFQIDECLFLVLDTPLWSQEQCHWLEEILQNTDTEAVAHTFIFGHHPVWPVARAFFTPIAFHQDMERLLTAFDVDAYFCGHTHNQNIIWHRTSGLPVFQFMGAMIGISDEPPLPLDHVQAFLPSEDDILACWPGYLENTAPGWFMVSVTSHEVIAEWHHLNRGAEAVVAWEEPGDVLDFWMMEQVAPSKLLVTDLGRIRRAFLRFCGWDGNAGLALSINGKAVGNLPVGDDFAPGRLELPAHILGELQMENRLVIHPSPDTLCTLGNLVLEVMLPGGRYIRTPATGELFSWADKWTDWSDSNLTQLKPTEILQTMLIFE